MEIKVREMAMNSYTVFASMLLIGYVISTPLSTIDETGGGYQEHEWSPLTTNHNKANIIPNLSVGISSLAAVIDGQIRERQLEISWVSIDGGYLEGDQIILYQYISEVNFCQSAGSAVVEQIVIDAQMANDSWVRLNTGMPHLEAGDLIDERCQHYWAAYVRQNNQIVTCNCLRARPNWMSDMKDKIKDVKLRELYLPGTHDAAAYERYVGLSSENMKTKYAITQDEDLFHQLSFGVRYLDMRIIFLPNASNPDVRFWTHHGSYILRPLVNDTALVREFISRTEEIVIFDIHGGDNLDQEVGVRQELQNLLYEEFGEWMAPSNLTWEATLNDFWSTGKRLVVTCNETNILGTPYFWPAIWHQWGNVNTVEDLETYLTGVMERAADGQLETAWSAMAELTPNSIDVTTDRLGGLRNAADLVNRNVTTWFRERWSEWATIVSLDFFLGSNIVDLAIQENQRRYP
ncbi:PI-PLC X domain-containing protein 1 isoform X2 [Daphnia magna]|uniref:PI-PLC X domain-containing protein 1 isoform X2 n=1 Tax=Daphnia magna TaxID=35525 RepID=UPI001E1BBF90|nr:PI-PLC X domain-containing protein 1 isoform X2 [Daphnia magna]